MNYALQPMSEDDFVALVTADQPDAPPYFTYDAVLNTRERLTLDRVLERSLRPLGVDDVLALRRRGAQVLDVRDPAEYGRAHLAGALNIGLSGSYATWAGTILDRNKPVVIVAEPGREQEAAMRLGRIGFEMVAGYLDGSIAVVEDRPELLEGIEKMTPEEAAAAMRGPSPPRIVDVRTPKEWAQTRIEGSLNLPLNHLTQRLDELPRAQPILVYCAGGYRSSIAAGLLRQAGINSAIELASGIAAWERAGLPVARSADTAGVKAG
jgi:rhodanese-related sulfurtransferase